MTNAPVTSFVSTLSIAQMLAKRPLQAFELEALVHGFLSTRPVIVEIAQNSTEALPRRKQCSNLAAALRYIENTINALLTRKNIARDSSIAGEFLNELRIESSLIRMLIVWQLRTSACNLDVTFSINLDR